MPVHFRNSHLPIGNWHCTQRSKTITVPEVLVGFSFLRAMGKQTGMLRDRTRIRKSGTSALCALMLSFALVSIASARQDSAGDPPAKKPSSSKKTASQTSHSSKSTASGTKSASTHTSKKRSKKKSAKVRGQQKIDGERAQEIQEALIREHYLSGEATGTWNQASEEAMRRYQADHGWQSKQVPDSRALISLGLGPSKDHLLNPESAMTTVPDRPKSSSNSIPTTSHSAPTISDPTPPGPTPNSPPNDTSRPQ